MKMSFPHLAHLCDLVQDQRVIRRADGHRLFAFSVTAVFAVAASRLRSSRGHGTSDDPVRVVISRLAPIKARLGNDPAFVEKRYEPLDSFVYISRVTFYPSFLLVHGTQHAP